ncbi:MAG: membrane-bound lytic murein transglycosylase MltF [Casimicrobiaceae bacterium]
MRSRDNDYPRTVAIRADQQSTRWRGRTRAQFRAAIATLALACVALTGCGRDPPRPGRIDPVELGRLVAAVVPGPNTYFVDAEGKPAGFEYDLLRRLANSLGVALDLQIVDDHDEALHAGELGIVHIVAIGANGMPPNGSLVAGPAYQSVQPVLVYRIDTATPSTWRDVEEQSVLTTPDQPVAEFAADDSRVRDGQVRFTQVPSARRIAETIVAGDARYGILYRHTLAFLRNVYLDIDAAFPIGNARDLRWRMPKSNLALSDKVDRYFAMIRKDGTLARLIDRYYGHTQRVNAQAAEAFQEKIRLALPLYRDLFQRAQDNSGIEWRLLAAIAYQESQWDPQATSPTNVRGMMMLTEDTSAQFKVTDRLDPAQSIAAGAQLVAQLKKSIPDRIPEPDRTWIALSAFNVGQGHMEDARVLAQQQKLNPDSWTDLKKSLPMLAKPEFAATAKKGFARGGQAVIFVENVRAYYDILKQFEIAHRAPGAPDPPPS